MLKRLPVFNFESLLVDFLLNDLSLSHLDLLLPPTLTVELFVIFAEIEAPVIQTLVKILGSSLLTILFKLSPTTSQLRILLLQPRQNNGLSHLCMRTPQHNPNHLSSINIRNDLEDQRMAQPFRLLNDDDCRSQGDQVRVNFILFLFIFQELLLELVLSCYHETALSSQWYRNTCSVEIYL